MRRLAALFLASAVALPAGAQTIAITGGTVYPVSGPKIENGTVLIRDGRIAAVGANVSIPADAQRVDATGKWVTPGLVVTNSRLGLSEVGAVNNTVDVSARGREGIAAAFRVWEGLDPKSWHWSDALDQGVTGTVVTPGGGLVSGQAAYLDLTGGTVVDMLRRPSVAMVVSPSTDQGPSAPQSRGEVTMRLRELFEDVRAYGRNRSAYDQGNTREFGASRLDLEAMQPVLRGTLPLMINADRASDIEAVLLLAKEYGFRPIITSGAEAWMVAKELAAAKVPVITAGFKNIPSSFAARSTRPDNAALLRKAGVQVVLVNDTYGSTEHFAVGNVRFEAGGAVANGMSWDDALRALTLAPAEVFGVGDRVGTLQAGRDANVVVWSGDPFEFSTNAERVFVKGVLKEQRSRQEQLMDRYKTVPPKY